MTSTFQSYSTLLRQAADRHPDRPAVIAVSRDGTEQVLRWDELISGSSSLATVLAARGVGPGSRVVVGLANSTGHVLACSAAWRLGACVLPLAPGSPPAERDQHLALFGPDLVIADWPDVPHSLASKDLTPPHPAVPGPEGIQEPAPDVAATAGRAIGTGGSTGRPKLLLSREPWGLTDDLRHLLRGFGLAAGDVQLVPGPLYHSFGFDWCYHGLMLGHTIVLLERFDAQLAVSMIERHRVTAAGLVPTMMRRIAALDDIRQRDLSSLREILHSAGPCPPSVKRAWIGLIGPDRVLEGYGASEGYGNTVIRGDDWLTHPGSVGRGYACEIRIVGPDGEPAPPGRVGEIYLRRDMLPPAQHLGADPQLTDDGFGSVGDLGWLDSEGYLYLSDRRVDLIVSGGVNVYPAEVEAALAEHPDVRDAAVVGLPDEEWGHRVHAIIELRPGSIPPSPEALTAHCRQHLAAVKAPRSYEFVSRLPRDDGGKLRRSALVAERTVGATR